MESEVQSWLQSNNLPNSLINYVVYDRNIRSIQHLVSLQEKELFIQLDQLFIKPIEKSKFKRIFNQKKEELQSISDSTNGNLETVRENSLDKKDIEDDSPTKSKEYETLNEQYESGLEYVKYNMDDDPLKKVEVVTQYEILKEQFDSEVEYIQNINKFLNGETTRFIDERWCECIDNDLYKRIVHRLLKSKENHQERAKRLICLIENTDRVIALPIQVTPIKKRNSLKGVKRVTMNDNIQYEVKVSNQMEFEFARQRQEAFLRNEELEKEKYSKDCSVWICSQCTGKNSKVYYFVQERDIEWRFLQCHVCSSRYQETYSSRTQRIQKKEWPIKFGLFPDVNVTRPTISMQYQPLSTPKSSSPESSAMLFSQDQSSIEIVNQNHFGEKPSKMTNPQNKSKGRSKSTSGESKLSTSKKQRHYGYNLYDLASKEFTSGSLGPSEPILFTKITTSASQMDQKVNQKSSSCEVIQKVSPLIQHQKTVSSLIPKSHQDVEMFYGDSFNKNSSMIEIAMENTPVAIEWNLSLPYPFNEFQTGCPYELDTDPFDGDWVTGDARMLLSEKIQQICRPDPMFHIGYGVYLLINRLYNRLNQWVEVVKCGILAVLVWLLKMTVTIGSNL